MSLHLPRTDPGGVFGGETGQSEVQDYVVLDDGQPVGRPVEPAVDHEARVLRSARSEDAFPAALAPLAVPLEHTLERRRLRDPTTTFELPDGTKVTTTRWIYYAGNETDVQGRSGGQETRRYFDQVLKYAGGTGEEARRTDARAVTAYDFRWRTNFGNEETPAYRVGTRYRTLTINRWGTDPKDLFYLHTQYIQGLYENVRLEGEVAAGWRNVLAHYTVEVAQVLRYEYGYDEQGRPVTILATWVDAWYNIAEIEYQNTGRRPSTAVPVLFQGRPYYYVVRSPGDAAEVLRDTLRPEWPPAPTPSPVRFLAAGGQVKVEGPRTDLPQRLDDPAGQPNATLTAFGHAFTGGTWAALRDAPLRREDGTLDWDRVLVLHASAETITAVQQDGSAATLGREAFEREVLRVPPGAFQGFSPIGTFFNTWPAHWAWARCTDDTRALVVHDAWRDSYKRDAPQGSPEHWSWKQRPGKRPRALPPSAPVAPLRLTLADVAGALLHDEPLKRAAPPLLLPVTATVQGRDVRRTVAKRLLYPPAQWPEELDDSRSTSGPLVLTFRVTPPAQGQVQGAALLLRLKLPPRVDSIKVNGEEMPLPRLGHNADTARGWHPYALSVPATSLYTLEFRGRCSRALLCVHTWTPQKGGGDA